MDLEFELTADGSHTLFVPQLDEHYHSVNGAIQESNHVFIESGLKCCPKNEISILEVGFGTGLNALLTLLYANQTNKQVRYKSYELYPLSQDVIEKLNYRDILLDKAKFFDDLHKAPWGEEVLLTSNFSLKKISADFTLFEEERANLFDLVYFDAFAPDKQPELWTQKIFDYVYKLVSANGILITYCAKGVVRRAMLKSGFKVERIPGPPGKREMLRAIK
ncbi:SAM-dependent methyltransferase [Dysgonomonas sp. 216]|uniref:tRNA (5-methylaminomethyl-2-thiouridine)(34)-methyltransferase MnmD n=1 Tax=Dysgonomonas sp. 216 TaxID=2302934 RepID=UPI0013D522FD|nr:tRNA (5-methylaminomethyl-2-thiouridine)(34)-methyltransferase MnmD [Dysgonomonas sp. 216]NDW19334.1 SAM-dependent methyltransferase [Dysgonomonas sp. 216]